ncbi:MAG TPA: Rieske 2Fe-2S domain-containing protein [Pirellulales bacterium]|jgi:nitrite reductase/ring-hydroxylating ferredoxin subunit|nr:Rieske 2Fe-2S domain-containing protein [Pirellulales bacterium]
MPNWVAIARTDQCPPGQGLELVAGERMVALYNVDGEFFALDGVCPHQGGPLGRGCLTGAIVTCPWHGWQFDVRTGQHQLSRTLKQPQFEVRVEQGQVLINLEDG